jgi:hypothetical protein
MRLPAVEALFPTPWPAAARRMLPSPSPKFTATAIWGPILGWCALELLAESINIDQSERVALDLFDRLRLREPFAQSFAALGFDSEESWRVAARIKVILLTGAGVGDPEVQMSETATELDRRVSGHDLSRAESKAKSGRALAPEGSASEPPQPGAEQESSVSGHDLSRAESQPEKAGALAPAESLSGPIPSALWSDPDVRWLTGIHTAEAHEYLVRESYEELLWWMQLPSLLKLAGETNPSRAEVESMSSSIADALAAAEDATYRLDLLLSPGVPPASEVVEPPDVPESDSADPCI